MLLFEASGAGFERQPARLGTPAQPVQFRLQQFMKRKVVGDLYHPNVRFGSLFEQANGIEGSRQPRVARYANGPRQAPR